MRNESEIAGHLRAIPSGADIIEAARGRYDDDGQSIGDHLYFVLNDDGFCKIGRSAYVAKRLSQLRSGNAQQLSLYMWLPGMGWQERVWHAAFRHIRHHREWYRVTPALRRAVEAARFGDEWIATLRHPRSHKPDDHFWFAERIADLEEAASDAAYAKARKLAA